MTSLIIMFCVEFSKSSLHMLGELLPTNKPLYVTASHMTPYVMQLQESNLKCEGLVAGRLAVKSHINFQPMDLSDSIDINASLR